MWCVYGVPHLRVADDGGGLDELRLGVEAGEELGVLLLLLRDESDGRRLLEGEAID